jgi:hypothetical protein
MSLETDIKLNFSDVTINETDGEKDAVGALMDPDGDLELWLLKTEFGIIGAGNDGFGELEFWQNGDAILTFYYTNSTTEMMPSDLLYLNIWVKERGWDFLIDSDLRAQNMDFWMRFDGMVADDEVNNYEYDEDEYEDDIDFLEYQEKMKQFKVSKMKDIRMTDLKEFEDHKKDHDEREKNERDRIF